MKKFESEYHKIKFPIDIIYRHLSDFRNFNFMANEGRLQDWQADKSKCSFKTSPKDYYSLLITKEVENQQITIEGDGKFPFVFVFHIQMRTFGVNETEIRLVLEAKLNFFYRLIVSGYLRKFVNDFARQLSDSFNANHS